MSLDILYILLIYEAKLRLSYGNVYILSRLGKVTRKSIFSNIIFIQ